MEVLLPYPTESSQQSQENRMEPQIHLHVRKGRLGVYVTTQTDRTDLGFVLRPGWFQVFPFTLADGLLNFSGRWVSPFGPVTPQLPF